MKKNKTLKLKFIGILSILFTIAMLQGVVSDKYEIQIISDIAEALAEETENTPPENGTCCKKAGSSCKLKNVTIIDNYLKESLGCK